MVFAVVLLLIAVGSVAFHFLSPWWWTPIASNWGPIDQTILITFWITGFVFTSVVLFMAYCLFRFRHRPGQRAAYEPENRKLEGSLALITAIGVAAMLAPGLLVWRQFVTVPREAVDVEVVGQQWQWSFRLPGKDERLGRSDPRFFTTDNPLGIDPHDPDARDDIVVQSGDLHLLVGKPVRILLRSLDVVHDFYVPEFRAKMDLMPGIVTYFWLAPTRTGTFEVLCAGFCGVGHPEMRTQVVVDSERDYQTWLGMQQTFAQLRSGSSRNASTR